MSERITQKDLDASLGRLASILGVGTEYGVPGNLTIGGAYGGWRVEQYVNDAGAITIPLRDGFRPKREVYEQIQTAIQGLSLVESTQRIIADAGR